ncbi:hypothetical protein ILYODFUR_007613 [Ilyodon furcidens]|uniref:Uncharacterized protein n=1 Tax=Ilyodon furcidens TaxID=33524 RepID=A0ABV0SY48_9TELE
METVLNMVNGLHLYINSSSRRIPKSFTLHSGIHPFIYTLKVVGCRQKLDCHTLRVTGPFDYHQQARRLKSLVQGHNDQDGWSWGSKRQPTSYKTNAYHCRPIGRIYGQGLLEALLDVWAPDPLGVPIHSLVSS